MFSIGYKPTKPEYRASLGEEVFRMRKYKYLGENVTFWQVKDIVDRIWSDSNELNQRIQEILVENKHRLKPKSSKKSSNFPSYALRCYMVGPDEDHATPHAVILCDCKYLGSKSREVILEHDVLSDVGWGRAFLHLTATVQRLMEEDDDILHAMPGSTYESREEGADIPVLCASLQFPESPTGVSIKISTRNSSSNSATLGGILKIDNKLYGITVAHIFEESRSHDMTPEEELTFDLSELDIYEGVALQSSALPEVTLSSGSASDSLQEIGIAHYPPVEIADCLDYALISVKPEIGWTANCAVTVQSVDSWQFYYPSHIAVSMPESQANILVPARYNVLTGKSVQSVSTLSISEPQDACRVWTISIEDVEKGQCGSWVLDEKGDQVLGILIAACPAITEAYILPMKEIASDIVSKRLGTEVALPEDQTSLLHKRLMSGHGESMDSALSNILGGSLRFRGEYNYPKIYQAAEAGNLAAVQQLIKKGYDVNESRGFLTVSPLYEAVRLQRRDAVERLIGAGFDVSQGVAMEQQSPLYVSIIHGHIDMAMALIGGGARTEVVYATRRYPPLAAAILTDSVEVTDILLSYGADILQPLTDETKSASEIERDYPSESLRSAIERAEESAKNLKEKKQQAEDDSDGNELSAGQE